mgnify:CR=1 FL=1
MFLSMIYVEDEYFNLRLDNYGRLRNNSMTIFFQE